MAKITRKQAEKEFTSWLDHKRIKERKREESKELIESIIDSFEDGILRLDPKTFEIHMKLDFPVTNSEGIETVKELTFSPRLLVKDVEKEMKGVKATDANGVIKAHVSALTGVSSGILSALDTSDYNVARAITTFFL